MRLTWQKFEFQSRTLRLLLHLLWTFAWRARLGHQTSGARKRSQARINHRCHRLGRPSLHQDRGATRVHPSCCAADETSLRLLEYFWRDPKCAKERAGAVGGGGRPIFSERPVCVASSLLLRAVCLSSIFCTCPAALCCQTCVTDGPDRIEFRTSGRGM